VRNREVILELIQHRTAVSRLARSIITPDTYQLEMVLEMIDERLRTLGYRYENELKYTL
jgi:hypothetical protein